MYRDTILICGGLVAALLLSSGASAQNEANDVSSRREGARIQFPRDDIFDRLTPLAGQYIPSVAEKAEAVPSTVPEVSAGESTLIELQSNQPQQPPAESVSKAPTKTLPPRVQELFTNDSSHLQAAEMDAYITAQLVTFSQDELQQLIAASGAALAQELAKVHFGDRWLGYLSLQQLHGLMATNDDEPNETNPRQQRLHAILQSYDRIARDRQFDAITSRHNFQLLRHGLAELLASPTEREQRREAYQAVLALSESLRPISTGAQWGEYFQVQRVAQLLSSPRPFSREEKSELQLILSRFERAAVEAQFQQVAKLPGFAATHRRLQLAVAVIPDAESPSLAADKPQASPAAEDAAQVRVLSEQGLTFVRQPNQAKWEIAGNGQLLTSESEVRTNEQGVARLVIGTNSEVVCAPDTILQIHQLEIAEKQFVTELNIQRGSLKVVSRIEPDLSPDAESRQPEQLIAIVYKGHRLISRSQELELDVREEPKNERVIASVYAGSILVAHGAGDEVTIRVGREAVMLPAGIAIRPAAKKPDAWWPTRGGQPASARNPASGGSTR